MMNVTTIERYVISRVNDNANWYLHKQMIAETFELSKVDEQIFGFFQVGLLYALQQGHTVLVADSANWQTQCLSPMIELLAGCIQKPDYFDSLLQQYQELLSSYRQDSAKDRQTLGDWVLEKRQEYQDLLNNNNAILTDKSQEPMHLFLLLLRLYYVMQVTAWGCLERFVGLLHRNRFFSHGMDGSHQYMPKTPLVYRYFDNCLYLWSHRAYAAEQQLIENLYRLKLAQPDRFDVDGLPDHLATLQVLAIQKASSAALTLITGGPGTGKTYTVAQIVLALYRSLQGDMPRLALAAPTGKAAQRMSESLQKSLNQESIQLPEPKTIHRLLGMGGSGLPAYHANNTLPYDVIIIDEASMLGTELACALLSAVKTGTRLIILGDANQLAAVDAGAVLADLCRMPFLADCRVHLTQSNRFDEKSGVGQLSRLINQETQNGDKKLANFLELLNKYKEIDYHQDKDVHGLYQDITRPYLDYFQATKDCYWSFAQLAKDDQNLVLEQIFGILNQYRILTASHLGAYGDDYINQHLTQAHKKHLKGQADSMAWYHGRVVMVVKNLYNLGLFNGDIGVCLRTKQGLMVYFEGQSMQQVSILMLDQQTVKTAYAMTVHKSQGSEWQQVSVVFDEKNERLLSKELLYTAVTRAKKQVAIHSNQAALTIALNRPTRRLTGLEVVEQAYQQAKQDKLA